MATVFPALDDALTAFIAAQPVYFVASAPDDPQGLVNVSPKGYRDTFAVLGPHEVAYLDLTGSGVETIAHVRQNGRLTVMFCSFDAKPRILRLHGRAEVVVPGDARWVDLLALFGEHVGARAVVVLHVQRIADSCGFAVPRMVLQDERDILDEGHSRRGRAYVEQYQADHNAASLDGLPALGPPQPQRS